MRGRVEAWLKPPPGSENELLQSESLVPLEELKPASRESVTQQLRQVTQLWFSFRILPEAGLAGLGGGFRDESGMGRVAVPSGYAGFTRTS